MKALDLAIAADRTDCTAPDPLLRAVERFKPRFDKQAAAIAKMPDGYTRFDRARAHAERALMLGKSLWRAGRFACTEPADQGRFIRQARAMLDRARSLERVVRETTARHPDFDNGEARELHAQRTYLERNLGP